MLSKESMELLNIEMEHLRQQIQWRREKVLELSSKGHSQREIENIKKYVDEKLPEEYLSSKFFTHAF